MASIDLALIDELLRLAGKFANHGDWDAAAGVAWHLAQRQDLPRGRRRRLTVMAALIAARLAAAPPPSSRPPARLLLFGRELRRSPRTTGKKR